MTSTSPLENNPTPASTDVITRPYSLRRIRVGLAFTFVGYLLFLLGTKPGLFGLDRSPVIGFVQISVFLVGLGIICLGGYLSFMALWKEQTRTIAADIGLRTVSTGFVIAVFAGMADIFGLGSHLPPLIPYFGEWQAMGVMISQAVIALGFLLLIPWKKASDRS